MARFVLDTFLPYQVAVLSARLSREFARTYEARFGIGVAEWRVVAHLSQTDHPVSVREIHARVDMDKSKVSRAASRLEVTGHVTKKVNVSDRRLVELELTPRGRAMVAEIAPLAQAYEARILDRLKPQDRVAFRDAVIRLIGEKP